MRASNGKLKVGLFGLMVGLMIGAALGYIAKPTVVIIETVEKTETVERTLTETVTAPPTPVPTPEPTPTPTSTSAPPGVMIVENQFFPKGLHLDSIDGLIIRNCEITARDGPYWALILENCSDFEVYNCKIHDTKGDGFHMRWCRNGKVHDNEFWNNSDDALAITSGDTEIEVYNNRINKTCTNVGSCIRVTSSTTNGQKYITQNIRIRDNEIIGHPCKGGNRYGIRVGWIDGKELCYDIHIHNNKFVNNDGVQVAEGCTGSGQGFE